MPISSSHSGAKIVFTENSIIKRLENNERNKRSLAMQVSQETISIGNYSLKPIPIHGTTFTDEYIYVKMPYINGINGEDFSRLGNLETARSIQSLLTAYIAHSQCNSTIKKISRDILVKKVRAIEVPPLIPAANEFKKKLLNQLNSMDFIEIPEGPYHGDLTFSNLIATNYGCIYIFDFLDSYINSYLLDVAKLYQDHLFGWSIRGLEGASWVSGKQFIDLCIPSELLSQIYASHSEAMDILSKINILRIAPYVKDWKTAQWMNDTINIIDNH